MSSWREITKPDSDTVLPPLMFMCRWRYGPGNFCSAPITPPERFCGRHEAEEQTRLQALKEEKVTT